MKQIHPNILDFRYLIKIERIAERITELDLICPVYFFSIKHFYVNNKKKSLKVNFY
jgi:hypothetical protein